MPTSVLSFVGDVWLPSGEYDFHGVSGEELLIMNLEGAITESTRGAAGKICLSSSEQAAKELFSTTKAIANLANNHILDFGDEGICQTLGVLEREGVRHFGAGTADNNFGNPLLLDRNEIKVALLGYVSESTHPGNATENGFDVARLSIPSVKRDVLAARDMGAERIIVCVHWGEEQVSRPKPDDIRAARTMSELGIDLVVGHHAHCVQPVAKFDKTTVFFGIGNAVFPDFDVELSDGRRAWAKQRYWNRRSLLVRYDVLSKKAQAQELRQDGRSVIRIINAGEARVPHLSKGELGGSGTLFRFYRRLSVVRQAASRFLARPRLPTPSAVKAVLSAIRSGGQN